MTADNVWFTLDGFSLTFDSTADVDLLVDKDLTGDTDSLFYNGRQKPSSVNQTLSAVITNFSAYRTFVQRDQILRVLLIFFLSPGFLNILCQTLKKIALRAHYICRGSKYCQRVNDGHHAQN